MKTTLAGARSTLLGIALVMVVAVWVLRDLALLVGYAVLLAYALLPVVTMIERLRFPGGRHLPRGAVAAGVVLALVALVGWLLTLAVPRVIDEATHFASWAPDALEQAVRRLRAFAADRGVSEWIDPAVESLRVNASGLVQNVGGTLATGAEIGRAHV